MRTKLFVVASLVVFVVLNLGILRNEKILAEGEIVFLKLAPVDPRSLIQGDYMRLSYEIAQGNHSEKERGRMVIAPDEHRVAKFVRFDEGESLQRNEKQIRYLRNWNGVSIVPDSYMFQEGHAGQYAAAEYGVFKFKGASDYLLVGLADKNLRIIQPMEK